MINIQMAVQDKSTVGDLVMLKEEPTFKLDTEDVLCWDLTEYICNVTSTCACIPQPACTCISPDKKIFISLQRLSRCNSVMFETAKPCQVRTWENYIHMQARRLCYGYSAAMAAPLLTHL